jgi:hypothetical protein
VAVVVAAKQVQDLLEAREAAAQFQTQRAVHLLNLAQVELVMVLLAAQEMQAQQQLAVADQLQ